MVSLRETLAAMAFSCCLAGTAAAQTVTAFAIPTAGAMPGGIVAGPDGNLWFTESAGNKIGRLSTSGIFAEFDVPTSASVPGRITAGPDGALWFLETAANKIGRITIGGSFKEFALPPATATPLQLTPGITTGPDGNLWFTAVDGLAIGRIATDGAVTEFPIARIQTGAGPITAGPDGNLWFVAGAAVGFSTVAGAVTVFADFDTDPVLDGIAAGADGALWFTEINGGEVGRITTAGILSQVPVPTATNSLESMLAGPDGALWFFDDTGSAGNLQRLTTGGTASSLAITSAATAVPAMTVGPDGALWLVSATTNQILRVVPNDAANVVLNASVLPGSRSIERDKTATVFATVINSGTLTATGCAVTPITPVPAEFRFQTTDAATNALTGQPNAPVDIAAGQRQSFLLSFTAIAALAPTTVSLGFACSNGNAAAIVPDLDTLLLSASATPVPDIVALAATESGNGIVDIPGAAGTGAFAVATADVGADGTITVSADTGSTSLPVTLSLCRTDPSSGQCVAAPAATVTQTIAGGGTPTFSVFVQGSGKIAPAPATDRVFVRFKDASGTVRGETSVAVQTQ
jgi:virginiamycin B lyase